MEPSCDETKSPVVSESASNDPANYSVRQKIVEIIETSPTCACGLFRQSQFKLACVCTSGLDQKLIRILACARRAFVPSENPEELNLHHFNSVAAQGAGRMTSPPRTQSATLIKDERGLRIF